ncbi:MAG: hypothetical protein PHG24_01360 [Candidatus Pacebacteria bacterium]|nr:hypothetical protein [Candidatus Paceibacterota bacterium]
MIDTIILLIPKEELSYNPELIKWELHSKTKQYEKVVRNPSKEEKSTNKYFPKITGYTRKYPSFSKKVRIEFSAPKLLYLNNLEELEDKDFPLVIKTLQERLQIMGINASLSILENASISSVHFSKNILLKDNYTVNYIISEINKINVCQSLDLSRARFINNGQSLYIHSDSHQFTIYDKIADLNKNKKRAIDKDQTNYQKTLFKEFQQRKEFQEIIRFELRFNNKKKLTKVLNDLGYKKELTFKNMFDSKMSIDIINSYWKQIVNNNYNIFSLETTLNETLQTILFNNSNIKPKQAVYLIGLLALSKDENGMRELRTILSKKLSPRRWYQYNKDLQEVNKLISKNNLKNWVIQINKSFEKYEPYKIKHKNHILDALDM